MNATFEWTKKQIDTYFNVNNGKLKLREQEGSNPELISYERPEQLDDKVSNYFLVPINSPDNFKVALENSLGIECIVEKIRTLFLWKNVRIHLDNVKHLGLFIEFEVVMDSDQMFAISKDQLLFLREQFKLNKDQLISCGYKELLKSINGKRIS